MSDGEETSSRSIPAIKVRQWLPDWDGMNFEEGARRRRPDPHFYVFSLSAAHLKALTGINRRTTEGGRLRSEDPNIQRRHEKGRSEEIKRFVGHGYPWSTLGRAKRDSGQYDDLRKPGWLPTAIIVNVLRHGDGRADGNVHEDDFVAVEDRDDSTASLRLPESFSGAGWEPNGRHPIEVIDGQHRLWAFEDDPSGGEFELPVVAYHGLDVSWQAYLFWTINIKPKRINSSLAFDLYPLLRTEDWLERAEGLNVYRETRAQELTESLWAHPASPWYRRINMLGESGLREVMVSQAAWIRALMATYVRSWESRGASIGGLYGAPVGGQHGVLPWSRAQQAAFLIAAGRHMRDAVAETELSWTEALRDREPQGELFEEEFSSTGKDPAFYGPHTLLNQDQGIRGLLYATNHLCYVNATALDLSDWVTNEDAGAADEQAVSDALATLEQHPSYEFLGAVTRGLVGFDWRTSAAPGLSDDERTLKAAFRGAGGYRELRMRLFRHLSRQSGAVGEAASNVLERVG